MVFDKLENAHMYYGLGKGVEEVLRFYEAFLDNRQQLPKEHALQGDRIYLIGMNYKSGTHECDELEAHTRYVDLMYVVEGEEKFYYKPFANVEKITAAYDEEDDCTMAAIDKDVASVRFPAGHFAIFFPQDAHCAAQLWDEPCNVRKFIAKIRLDTL